jgi:predicted tellurium resistance membrane protein TerC
VAVAMIDNIYLIIGAIVIAMLIMVAVAKKIGEFIYQNPGIKVLGLVFIILIGLFLIANSFNLEVSKAYLYSAMFVSLIVELINIKLRNN